MLKNRAVGARFSIVRSCRQLSTYAGNNVLGILREEFGMWERRVPLSPVQVKDLLQQNPKVKVLIQPCTRRIFSNMEYEQAGAVVTEDLSPASFLIGVKTVKPEKLVENKSYMFFSHTIKAQPGSMKLLDTILEKKVRLYDYEAITVGGRDDAPRAVAFGGYAGRAGMIDGLQGLGLRLLAEGYSTPFLHLPTTYMHQNWEQAQHAIRSMGKLITSAGLPVELSPLVIAFTGNGNVSKGAREVFELLPHEYIKVEELATITEQIKAGKRSANKLYGVVVEKKDLVQLKTASSGPFDGADYYRNPSNYESIFHRTVLPHVQMLVNGIYWDSRFPRLVTKEQIKKLRSEGNRQLRVVADISCDIDGSCEFLTRPSTIEDPYYTYDPETNEQHSEIDHSGILMLAVDNLPSELPRDASEHFGAALLPLIPPILASKGDNTLSDLPAELKRACLFSNGEYMPKWSYIARLREQSDAVHGHHHAVDANAKSLATMKIELVGHLFDTGLINQVLDLLEHDEQVEYTITNCDVRPNNTSGAQYSRVQLELKGNDLNRVGAMADTITAAVSKTPRAEGTVNITDKLKTIKVTAPRTVLLFGSGRVAKPLVKLFDTLGDVNVIIASEDEAQAQDLINVMPGKARFQKYRFPEDNVNLAQLVKNCDVVVSLLPATMHMPIAEEAVTQGRHMVTASYVSPEMQALDARAKAAGVVLLNEVGLDPGIDHLLIMKSIDSIHQRGGSVSELVSLCGGLPDPVAADNPLRYKMSWSPRGVLNAAGNSAKYLANNKIVSVAGEDLLLATTPSNRFPTLRLEVIPNRDSLTYRELYGVPDVHSICRGTLRYEGWANAMHALKALGLFAKDQVAGLSIDDIHGFLARSFPGGVVSEPAVRSLLASKGVRDVDMAIDAVRWLGMFDKSEVKIAPSGKVAAIDSLCKLLEERLQYKEGEKDMVAMFHTVTGEMPDGSTESHTSRLLAFGTPGGDSAMSETVGYTTAAAAELVLNNMRKVGGPPLLGVRIPTHESMYTPIMARIQDFGINWTEDIQVTKRGGNVRK